VCQCTSSLARPPGPKTYRYIVRQSIYCICFSICRKTASIAQLGERQTEEFPSIWRPSVRFTVEALLFFLLSTVVPVMAFSLLPSNGILPPAHACYISDLPPTTTQYPSSGHHSSLFRLNIPRRRNTRVFKCDQLAPYTRYVQRIWLRNYHPLMRAVPSTHLYCHSP
jgi:hypothetical protein